MTEDRSRRAKGSGSIYTRKDGRVVGEYEANGKKRYVYGKTKKDMAAKLAKAIADRDAGLVYDSGKLTVGAYLDKWLDAIRDTLRRRTVQRHEQIARLHLKPTLGKVKLNKLNALQLQTLYRQKLDSGLSPRTVQIIHATIYKALKQAVRWQLIPRNVAEAVNPPKAPKAEINPLSLTQVKALLNSARGDRFEALYILAVTTGMRSGELLGLQWRDVDLEVGVLQVRRTVFNGEINAPKTARSNRSIKLSNTAIEALRRHSRISLWVFSSNAGTS